jgi:hypothetical protein
MCRIGYTFRARTLDDLLLLRGSLFAVLAIFLRKAGADSLRLNIQAMYSVKKSDGVPYVWKGGWNAKIRCFWRCVVVK